MATAVSDLDTPAVVIDLDIVEANIRRAQEKLASHGFKNRPHIKTHKIPTLAKMQMDAGAIGITCQKIGEAEVMADAGVADDILLTYNIIGDAKTERLAALIRRLKRMAVVVDNEVVARGLSEAGKRHGVDIRYLIECDTGGGRNGVQTPQAALDLANQTMRLPNMRFEGLMTYPTRQARAAARGSNERCSFSTVPASRPRSSRAAARRCSRTVATTRCSPSTAPAPTFIMTSCR